MIVKVKIYGISLKLIFFKKKIVNSLVKYKNVGFCGLLWR